MKKLYMLLVAVLLMVITGCSSSSDPIPPPSSSVKAITAFSLAGVDGTINETAKTIAVAMPFGTDVTALVATFTTTGASVKVGSTVQISGTTANNFTSQVTYTVTAADSSTQDYTVTVTVALFSAKAITSFSLQGVVGTINETGKTIAVTMPFGTSVTNLVATFTTTGASVKVGSTVQISGTTANNFTSQVTYTVTAADSSTQDYTVTVTVALFSAKAITAFSLQGVVGTINETGKTIAVTMPFGTSVTNLVATFTTTGVSVKVGSTVQISGTTAHNFTSPVTYTVTAADATTQDYTVTVAVAVALSSAKAITAFTFPTSTGTTIDEDAHTIVVTVPDGTDVTALVPAITHTGASISPETAVAHDFTSAATYTVTAEDASTQAYVVTVASDYTSANIGTLKYVPAGSFQRDATATNITTITTAFRMGQYEITRAQYLAITGYDPSDAGVSRGMTDPVQLVTWYDMIEFCNDLSTLEGLTPVYTITRIDPVGSGHPINDATVTVTWANNGYRLPTDMEWMWAAMGATSDRSNGYTGTGINTTGYIKGYAGSTEAGGAQINIGDYAWTNENNSPYGTKPIGTAGTTGHPNELDLYDMSGNVWEWCWDWLRDYPDGDLNDTTYRDLTSGTYRVARGGGWNAVPSMATVAYRSYYEHGRINAIGFRVVQKIAGPR